MRSYLFATGAGVLSFALLAMVGVAPQAALLGILGPLPLFAAGLSFGLRTAAIAAGVVIVLALALGGGVSALAAFAVYAGPVLLLLRQALLSRPGPDGSEEWYPPGLLVGWLTLIGLGLVSVTVAIIAFTGEGAFATRLSVELQAALGRIMPQATAQEIEAMASGLAPYAIGFSVSSWLTVLSVNGALAQGVSGLLGTPRRPSPKMPELELPRWVAPALAVCLAAAFFAPGDIGFVAQNFAIVLLLAFFFAGLAVMHAMVQRSAARGVLLTVLYGAIVLFTFPALLVTGLGLLDQLAGLRRRANAKAQGREDE